MNWQISAQCVDSETNGGVKAVGRKSPEDGWKSGSMIPEFILKVLIFQIEHQVEGTMFPYSIYLSVRFCQASVYHTSSSLSQILNCDQRPLEIWLIWQVILLVDNHLNSSCNNWPCAERIQCRYVTSDDPGPDWDTAQHVRENSRGSAAAVSRSPK